MKRVVLLLLLAACDEPPVSKDAGCSQPCDDGDPCTDDGCDPATNSCRFVPRDVINACRSDAHCDDGAACSLDACVIDECGLQRCRHDLSACTRCEKETQCFDGDGCSDDGCSDGLCLHADNELCDDRRCDPTRGAPPSECHAAHELGVISAWTATVAIAGQPKMTCPAFIGQYSGPTTLEIDCERCGQCTLVPFRIAELSIGAFASEGITTLMPVEGTGLPARVVLVPTRTGFSGAMIPFPADSAGLSGSIILVPSEPSP